MGRPAHRGDVSLFSFAGGIRESDPEEKAVRNHDQAAFDFPIFEVSVEGFELFHSFRIRSEFPAQIVP